MGRLPAGIGIPSEEGTRDLVTDGSSVNGPSKTRRTLDYWATVLWLTAGTVIWIILRDVLWFVGFMSLYAIWITHLAGWAAETPVEEEAPVEEAEAATNEAPEPAATSQEAA